MKKSVQLTSRQLAARTKFTKHQSQQISSNNIYIPKNSSIQLLASPLDSKKSLKTDRLFSPSEKTKDKTTVTNKQKLKNLKIFSPNNKNKLNLEIKKSLFDKNAETIKPNQKLKYPKDIENEHFLTSYNENKEKSPYKKNNNLNKKIMISESKKKGKNDENSINDLNNYSDRFDELDKDTLNTYRINQKDEILNTDINLDEKMKKNNDSSFCDNNSKEYNRDSQQKQLKLIH